MKKKVDLILLVVCVACLKILPVYSQQVGLVDRVQQAMHNATKHMVEQVSMNGGYARLYSADLQQQWHELEGYRSQIGVEEPGTVSMGHLFLDAYHITHDEFYYEAAVKAANALIWGQLSCGGWNYFIDFAGDRSLKQWYNTIGKHAWGFEEHYHYYGNATFDDNVTAGAAGFLLRIYLQKLDPLFKPALERAIAFILEAQYPLGGWPQRYPLMHDFPKDGKPDYTSYYTFNDGVIANNLGFLIDCYVALGQDHLLDPIRRAMSFYLITQQAPPQGGWAQQYDLDLEPAHARSYEPASINTKQTVQNIQQLFWFYRLTGDEKFLKGIPDAIDWLESAAVPAELTNNGRRTHFFDVEVGTNRGLWSHRKGSGVQDGQYWVDHDSDNAYAYGLNTKLDVVGLKVRYEELKSMSVDEVTKESPLLPAKVELIATGKDYFLNKRIGSWSESANESEVIGLMEALDGQYRWLSTNEWIGTVYADFKPGERPNTALRSEQSTGRAVMDTSAAQYISTAKYTANMKVLLNFVLQNTK